ncbi:MULTISPECIES: hypothetical protein [unclassified Streptomyces]|uniref:hypothetical protein n=1 Tax=unclassified Streptomyces TaxID=2593676 RepID=UPI0029AB335B|nr:hypothetical protein [Streptomyces sp. FL07-04A]MDX3579569.1 hypothetical protein [Streptomyces sp. FL07-04A]
MPSIQHAPRPVRLLLANGPELHLSMYRRFVVDDDAGGHGRREAGTANERSGP